MKIGFILPGKFHFKPVLSFLAEHDYLKFLFMSSSNRLSNWLYTEKKKDTKYYNSVLFNL